MAEELPYHYYIPYLIRSQIDGHWGFGYSFTSRSSPLETRSDIEDLISDLERESGLTAKSILLIDWKRIQ